MGGSVRFGDLSEVRQRLSPQELVFERRRRTVGLFLGPAAFALLLLFPLPGLAPAAARLAAVIAWVLVFWITEAIPIPVTSLLGPALMVALGVTSARDVFAAFGDPVIFLFLGSFVLAEAMGSHGLDRRIAFGLLSTRLFAGSATRITVGFAVLAAGLSMWLSNTATTAMLYPIAIGVIGALTRVLGEGADATRTRFGTGLLLVCAYASSVGGLGTPVGTPPNLIALGQLAKLAGVRVPFFQWMLIAVPILLVLLAVVVVFLRVSFPPEAQRIEAAASLIAEERRRLGPWTAGQRNVVGVFALTVFLWILPGVVALIAGTEGHAYLRLAALLPESVVAVLGACLLFMLPVDWHERRFTISWSQAVRIDWGTLLLFGGGLALGSAMFKTGLAAALGHALTSATGARSTAALTFVFAISGVVLTEVTSNTATATMLTPLAIAAAQAAGVSPLPPAIGCALACSVAFMLPVSTPPNAIVYGSGCVRITQMVRAGFWIDLVSALIVPTGVLLTCRWAGLY
jgi:sodium-dependent dicarboxylate transporter 2/3/5